MPHAIAIFLLETVSASLAASATAVAITEALVTIGLTVGANFLTQAIFGPSRPKPSDGQQLIRTSVGSRYRDYGIVSSSGQLTFLDSSAGTLGQVVTLSTGRQGPILEHKINDKVVTVDAGGTVTQASFHDALHIYTRPGDDDQTAIAELTAKFPEWTADHRQLGCPHAAIILDPVKQKYFSEVTNGQMPQYTQTRKGAWVYDPRKDSTAVIGFDEAGAAIMGAGAHRLDDEGTWEWTDNGPLVTADYFAHPDGYGGGYDQVNWTTIAQEADIADQQVLTVTGEQIARWRIWARYGLAVDKRADVLASMLKAIDGFCWQDADGKFNLLCGRWIEPTVTITDDHILSLTATLGPDASQQTSAVKVLYTEAAIGYREQESATIANPEIDDDPSTDPQAVEAYYVPAHNQATRVGKIIVMQLGDRWHITAVLNLFGLNLLAERFMKLSSARLGVAAYFKVDGLKLNLGENTVQATLAEVKPSDWDFDAAAEEGTPPIAPGGGGGPAPVVVPAPTGLELTAVPLVFGSANGVAIEATWDDPGRPDLSFAARFQPVAGGTWISMSIVDGAFTARSGPVDSGVAYLVEVWAITIGGRESAAASDTITPVAAATLGRPTLSVSGGAGEASATVILPADDAVAFARLYHSDSNDFGTATQVGGDIVAGPGVAVTVSDTGLSAGTEYYWARAFDGSGGSSPLTGPAPATIS